MSLAFILMTRASIPGRFLSMLLFIVPLPTSAEGSIKQCMIF